MFVFVSHFLFLFFLFVLFLQQLKDLSKILFNMVVFCLPPESHDLLFYYTFAHTVDPLINKVTIKN